MPAPTGTIAAADAATRNSPRLGTAVKNTFCRTGSHMPANSAAADYEYREKAGMGFEKISTVKKCLFSSDLHSNTWIS